MKTGVILLISTLTLLGAGCAGSKPPATPVGLTPQDKQLTPEPPVQPSQTPTIPPEAKNVPLPK